MKTTSLLIRFPGFLFGPDALMPDRELACVASSLLETGHETSILDFGTVETLERLFPPALKGRCEDVADDVLSPLPVNPVKAALKRRALHGIEERFIKTQARYCEEIAAEIAARRGLGFVAFRIARDSELAGAHAIAAALKARIPSLPLVAFGPFAELYAEVLIDQSDVFDCYCVGDAEASIPEWADHVSDRDAWNNIPNLMFRSCKRVVETEARPLFNLDALPHPNYDAAIYPGIQDFSKFKLFPLEDSRGSLRGHAVPVRRWRREGARVRSSRSVCDELAYLRNRHAATVFDFPEGCSSAAHVETIAQEILSRGFAVSYCRAGHAGLSDLSSFKTLKASGCAAISYRIETGSQRLMELYYGRDYRVSQVEGLLRQTAQAGMFTIPVFTYPCPEDDYHSADETLRMIRRTKPHAVRLDYPDVLPGSAWHKRADEFGFSLNRTQDIRDAIAGKRKILLPQGNLGPVPSRVGGLTPRQLARVNATLRAELDELSISSSLSPATALMANLCGYAGREDQFGRLLRRKMVSGDVAGVASLVEEFNAANRYRANVDVAMSLTPYEPSQIAVGN